MDGVIDAIEVVGPVGISSHTADTSAVAPTASVSTSGSTCVAAGSMAALDPIR